MQPLQRHCYIAEPPFFQCKLRLLCQRRKRIILESRSALPEIRLFEWAAWLQQLSHFLVSRVTMLRTHGAHSSLLTDSHIAQRHGSPRSRCDARRSGRRGKTLASSIVAGKCAFGGSKTAVGIVRGRRRWHAGAH